jgi:Skp family chaperone for outer membrane proteins
LEDELKELILTADESYEDFTANVANPNKAMVKLRRELARIHRKITEMETDPTDKEDKTVITKALETLDDIYREALETTNIPYVSLSEFQKSL